MGPRPRPSVHADYLDSRRGVESGAGFGSLGVIKIVRGRQLIRELLICPEDPGIDLHLTIESRIAAYAIRTSHDKLGRCRQDPIRGAGEGEIQAVGSGIRKI